MSGDAWLSWAAISAITIGVLCYVALWLVGRLAEWLIRRFDRR